MKRTSLKDLAQKLGVSIATVSRALSGSHEVSEAMRERVRQLATDMNYRPNPFAQGLRSDSPKVIGVILPNLVTHYYASVLDGIEDYALQHGYSVVTANSHEHYEMERNAVDNYISMHVKGIIACLAQDTVDYSHFKELRNMNVPLVFVARTCLPELFSSVLANDDKAAYDATQHLIANGCRRIAYIGGPNLLDSVRRRKHGYLEALKENRIPIDRSIITSIPVNHESAYQSTLALLSQDNRPDAILAFNDIILHGTFMAVKSQGLSIPQDLAIVGFSESESTAYVTPALSVIMDQSHLEGRKACEHLLRHIGGDNQVQHETVPMIFTIRESCRRK